MELYTNDIHLQLRRDLAKRNCEYYDRLEITLSQPANKFKLPIFTRAGSFRSTLYVCVYMVAVQFCETTLVMYYLFIFNIYDYFTMECNNIKFAWWFLEKILYKTRFFSIRQPVFAYLLVFWWSWLSICSEASSKYWKHINVIINSQFIVVLFVNVRILDDMFRFIWINFQ